MTRMVLTLGLILAMPLALPTAMADVLLIEQVRQAERMTLPVNGETKAAVEARYGTPVNRSGPVGDPPISKWEYQRWSVYFEYDRVLFTVIHKGEVIEKDAAGQ